MANRLAFHHLPGNSILHRWDTRCKVFALLIITFGLLDMTLSGLILFSAILIALLASAHLPLGALIRDLKGWFFLLMVIFLLQTLGSNSAISPPPLKWLPFTEEGILSAAMTCWRLLLILSYGLLFTITTKPRDLQHALICLLQPVPFLPAQRVALMVTLTIRLLPTTLDHLDEVFVANRARLGNQHRNLLRRIKYISIPLFRRSFLRADELACALAARGYQENQKLNLPHIPPSHLAALFLVLITVLFSSSALSYPLQQINTMIAK